VRLRRELSKRAAAAEEDAEAAAAAARPHHTLALEAGGEAGAPQDGGEVRDARAAAVRELQLDAREGCVGRRAQLAW
jgi:hypothetical protein